MKLTIFAVLGSREAEGKIESPPGLTLSCNNRRRR
jgi:hypothetical protein